MKKMALKDAASMNRSAAYELIAKLLAFGGVVMFGFGIFPCVNPIQFGFIFGPGYLWATFFALPASVIIMWIAWRLSQQATALKRQEQNAETKGQKDAAHNGAG